MRNVGKIMITAAVAVGLTACAPSEQASTQPQAGPSTPGVAATKTAATGTTTAATPAAGECTADDVKVTGAANTKPQITLPTTCTPSKKLLVKDLTPGTGPELAKGDDLLTHYLLVTWSNKAEKDSSWSRNQPYPLKNVGEASVIDGWNEGLIGIKQGARRLLVVPPEKGYGPDGGGKVAANETLVFVIDAVQITHA